MVAALTRPLAPPDDQRSCCQLTTRLSGFIGLIATCGSTSALRYSVPVPVAQPMANGDGTETRISVSVTSGGKGGGGGGGGGTGVGTGAGTGAGASPEPPPHAPSEAATDNALANRTLRESMF